ncbi:hypothetical protein LGQ02_11585 [Bacillus shivajii]|uniref:hypothetical protein n=1 Tax=Bacillus shivajii TaxID=1983719 RepID=UPI001CFA3F2E|nr:hypothetical protein [Bacillus shivajii]UCZ51516.1 hypothetical protein LGQ02_11585 [Bacillus shivajii]
MKIIENLEFIHEHEKVIFENYKVFKRDMEEALEGIKKTIEWLRTSLFQYVVDDLIFYISDEPINFPAELAIEEESEQSDECQFIVYLNIMSISNDYKNREYILDLKKDHVTCLEYSSFILLHEIGHFIHGNIGISGSTKKDRLYGYFEKGEHFYTRYIEKMKHGYTTEEKKRYRRIPQEKAADAFARQWLDVMMEDL